MQIHILVKLNSEFKLTILTLEIWVKCFRKRIGDYAATSNYMLYPVSNYAWMKVTNETCCSGEFANAKLISRQRLLLLLLVSTLCERAAFFLHPTTFMCLLPSFSNKSTSWHRWKTNGKLSNYQYMSNDSSMKDT